ncbi:BAH_G0052110.mRNA.1.CDS.1 [Saccharomyces cerevisiae]|nr:BAH_G0052110.mRNA.1.CDS.1 [Saccharomyces cerevisiae]CAI7341858.1 BAH_G0052110.mRNA.1.CDS.1 [Saccharomyces cerevisiae]
MALKAQGRSNDEIADKSILGVYGGILGIPIHDCCLYCTQVLSKRLETLLHKRSEMDLDTGCSVENLELFKAQKKRRNNSIASKAFSYKSTDFGVRRYSCICNL